MPGREEAEEDGMGRGSEGGGERLEEVVGANVEGAERFGGGKGGDGRGDGHGEAERTSAAAADKVTHLVCLGIDGGKVAELVVQALCLEGRRGMAAVECVLHFCLLLEGVEDGAEMEAVYAKGKPSCLPDAFVAGEASESTRAAGVGGDVRDGEVGEDGDVDVDGETADDLERGRGGGWQWLAVVVDVVVVETDRL